MKIYLAGPITGRSKEEIRQSFHRMEFEGVARGVGVYNPARLPEGLSWGTYMQMALAVLCSGEIDRVIMLRGWQDSKGAQTERMMAMGLGIPVKYEVKDNGRTVDADELLGILQGLESSAEEHPECQLRAAPLLRKISGIVEKMAR